MVMKNVVEVMMES